MEPIKFVYDDGGRSKYFSGKNVGDCVCRAITIASGKDYKEIYDLLAKTMGESPRNGVFTNKPCFKRMMRDLGFEWHSLAGIGVKQAFHFYDGELPREGRMVCSVTKHNVAVVNNELHDIWDSRYNSFGQMRRIYGYWLYKGDQVLAKKVDDVKVVVKTLSKHQVGDIHPKHSDWVWTEYKPGKFDWRVVKNRV